jgi:lysophospholipid acyltransferase (LPLAT)-like uncharacterized protein
MFRSRALPFLIFLFYRALVMSWRIRIYEDPEYTRLTKNEEPLVIGHWHGDELAILHMLKYCRACAMVSTSADGAIMDGVIRLLGSPTSRGSSTRGGVSALKGILRLSKEGWRPSVAVDGPKGPIYKVKPGIFEIAKLTRGRIVPLTAVTNRSHIFEKAWNKTFLPLPFAKVQVVLGPPLPAISRDVDSRSIELAQQLEQALANAQQHARNLIATA